MLLPTFSTLSLLTTLTTALLPTKIIYEAAPGTWFENLAIRPNGNILLTTLTSSGLYQVNPQLAKPTVSLVHNFNSSLWTIGITETTPDTFYVIAANGSLKTLTVAPESHHLFRVKFNSYDSVPEISLAATIPDAGLLNGATTLNATTVLAADSHKGIIYAINVLSGASTILISDPLMFPTAAPPGIGINGIKIRRSFSGDTLYFTNGATNIFAKIPLSADGSAAGPATIVTHAPTGAGYDDFTFDQRGDAFLATGGGNSIAEVTRDPVVQRIVAGNINSTDIAEPTSAQFGRTFWDQETLYVTTSGGLAIPVQTVDGPVRVGGQVVAVDTRELY